MKITIRWGLIVFLVFVTVLLVNKGIGLWSLGANVDGDGIGVHFLGLGINDRVPEAKIPSYATGFFIASAITFLVSIVLAAKSLLKFKNNSDAI